MKFCGRENFNEKFQEIFRRFLKLLNTKFLTHICARRRKCRSRSHNHWPVTRLQNRSAPPRKFYQPTINTTRDCKGPQLLILAHKFSHRKYILPNTFANYFTVNNAIHSYNTRMRENLHLASVSKNYAKRTVKYKASTLWNQLPSSLKEFSSIKYFSNKLQKFLQTSDIHT